jgi:cyclase
MATVMMRSIVLVFVFAVSAAAATEPGSREVWGRKYDLVELAPGVFSVIWREVVAGPVAIGNSTFIINEEDVIVVDTTFLPGMARAVVEEIRGKTTKPVRYVVVTHYHEDHTAGIQVFREAWPGLEVVGHPNTRTDLTEIEAVRYKRENDERQKLIDELAAKPDRTEREERALPWYRNFQAEITAVHFQPPTMLVADSLILQRGERTIEISHPGLGNTRGDIVVFLPKEKIAITGDLAILPVQFALGSFIGPWIATLDRVAALEATTWVPGHGPVQHDSGYVRNVRNVLFEIHTRVAAGVKLGRTLEELKKSIDVPAYRKAAGAETGVAKEWYDQYFITPAIERAYAELTARK